jgi:hypothetical protein
VPYENKWIILETSSELSVPLLAENTVKTEKGGTKTKFCIQMVKDEIFIIRFKGEARMVCRVLYSKEPDLNQISEYVEKMPTRIVTKRDNSGKPIWVLSATKDQQIMFTDFGPTTALKKEYSDKSKEVIIQIVKSYDQNLTDEKFQEIITRLKNFI